MLKYILQNDFLSYRKRLRNLKPNFPCYSNKILLMYKDLECGSPAQISHGSYKLLNGTRHYLSTVQYTCDEGYVLVGRGNLVCDVDEKWNGPPPRCDRKFINCFNFV